jgi:hypothetical protein
MKGQGLASEPFSIGTSIRTGALSFNASAINDLSSFGYVARNDLTPKLSPNFTKSGLVRSEPM